MKRFFSRASQALLLVVCVVAFVLGCFGLGLAAQSATSVGGAFLPGIDYVLGGVWTFKGASPLVFEGATNDGTKTTLTVTDPTANRTLTLPDATDTLVGKATTDVLTNKTLTSATLTSPVLSTISNTGTLTMPTQTGSVPVVQDCQSTGSGNQTCTQQTATALGKVYVGKSTLAANAATITFSPGFTGTTDFMCVANDVTTRANPVQMIPASATTATITNTTGATDVIQWICAGQ